MQDRKFTKKSPGRKPTEKKAGNKKNGRRETYRKENKTVGIRQETCEGKDRRPKPMAKAERQARHL
jgi:hypothetical protein